LYLYISIRLCPLLKKAFRHFSYTMPSPTALYPLSLHDALPISSPTATDTTPKISIGVFYLSPVGFDATRTRAIAYENYICGNLCGWGAFRLLVKNAGKWEEAKDLTACTWRY